MKPTNHLNAQSENNIKTNELPNKKETSEFKNQLNSHTTFLADGGMTTSLYDRGFYIHRSFEELNLTHPQDVLNVSLDFKKAGAQILNTNSFNALETKLTKYGLQDQRVDILKASVKIAREASSSENYIDALDPTYVLGSMGPLGVIIEPLGSMSRKEAQEMFKKNVMVFEECKVDGYSLLSFHDLSELETAILAIRELSQKPIFAHVGIQGNMQTSFGFSIQEFVNVIHKHDVEVLGFSGEVGPNDMLTALQILRPLTERAISIAPNAGLPRYVNDEYIYMCNPDYLGKFAKRFAQAGAQIIGGHSGVSAAHIQAMNNSLRMLRSSSDGHVHGHSLNLKITDAKQTKTIEQTEAAQQAGNVKEIEVVEEFTSETAKQSTSLILKSTHRTPKSESQSYLAYCLAHANSSEKIISIEINPPKGVELESFLELCESLDEAQIPFVNIPDGARAMARMSSLQLASLIKNKFHIEPIPHFTTRDRNLIGLQSDLLGAYINGVKNVLVVTGDPPKLGNCPGATAVYDVDAIGLTHIIHRMNHGLDLGGSPFGTPTNLCNGVALNPTAINQELEIQRFKYKIEAGAQFAITQPIYDLDVYKQFFEACGECPIPIIMGVWPLVSLRNAEFLKYEVPGVSVPDIIIQKMGAFKNDKEASLKVGIELAAEIIEKSKGFTAGYQISAPFNKVSVALEVIKQSKVNVAQRGNTKVKTN